GTIVGNDRVGRSTSHYFLACLVEFLFLGRNLLLHLRKLLLGAVAVGKLVGVEPFELFGLGHQLLGLVLQPADVILQMGQLQPLVGEFLGVLFLLLLKDASSPLQVFFLLGKPLKLLGIDLRQF